MHYLALASDYDGTLAKDGVVSPQTIDALERLGASGRQLILVTGRLLEDLQKASEEQWNESGFWRKVGGNLFSTYT